MNLILGDCLIELRNIPDDSIDSIVTDPPAAISFMNKKWDHDRGGRDQWIAWLQSVADECFRVLKPGAHALVWTLPRTSHWTAMAFENAGFEVRDKIVHIFAQGFPKSLNVSAAIDKKLGATREVIGVKQGHEQFVNRGNLSSVNGFKGTLGGDGGFQRPWMEDLEKVEQYHMETAPATPEAQQWNGFGTALKPAHEDWLLLRKPLIGTVVDNVLTHGTGALNIDACRVGVDTIPVNRYTPGHDMTSFHGSRSGEDYVSSQHTGRFPANLTHDGNDEVTKLFPQTGPSKAAARGGTNPNPMDWGNARADGEIVKGHDDNGGSAARFYYCAKASKTDRNEGLDSTCTVKYNVPIGGALCKDVTMALVALLQKVTSELTVTWNIDESGESIMGLCPSDTLSTTLTEINKTTTSQILNLLTPSLTNVFIRDANCEMENGGNRVENVGNSNAFQRITTNENQVELVRGVSHVVEKMLLTIGNEENWKPLTNFHSTVKATALMRWLVRLITPPNGTVLDPFAGSGSTGKAAILEGFDFIGIELDPDYYEIAKRRIAFAQTQVDTQLQLPLNMETK